MPLTPTLNFLKECMWQALTNKDAGNLLMMTAVLGTTKKGEMIVLKDENEYTFQLVEVSVSPY